VELESFNPLPSEHHYQPESLVKLHVDSMVWDCVTQLLCQGLHIHAFYHLRLINLIYTGHKYS